MLSLNARGLSLAWLLDGFTAASSTKQVNSQIKAIFETEERTGEVLAELRDTSGSRLQLCVVTDKSVTDFRH